MSMTVAIISETGRLVNVLGANGENDSRYLKFVKRLLGSSNSTAVLNYGWNGDAELVITGDGGTGDKITLDAREVAIPGDLTIDGKTLDEIISSYAVVGMSGIRGTEGEITVTPELNPEYDSSDSSGDQPEYLYVVGLSQDVLDRIALLEEQVQALFRFDDVYYAGDGLVAIRDEDLNNTINVRIGYGLKFVEVEDSGSSSDEPVYTHKPPTAVTVDVEALNIGNIVAVDPVTGNMCLYNNNQGD